MDEPNAPTSPGDQAADASRAAVSADVLWRAVEQCPATIVITDRDGTIAYVNPYFERLTGFRREDAIGKNPRILKSGRTPPAVFEDLWRTIRSGRTWTGHLVNRKRDGAIYHERAAISPLFDETGAITHFIAVKTDVTEALHREAALLHAASRELEAAYRELDLVFQTATGGMRIIGNDFTVVRANETLSRMVGLSRAEMVGRKCWETFPGPSCETEACTLRRVRRGETLRGFEIEKRAANGQPLTCSLDVRELLDEQGQMIGIIEDFRDLTETRRLQSVAEAVNTANNIGFAFSGIRHELGNPVNAVKTTLAVLKRRLDVFPRKTVEDYLDRALSDVARMEYLLRFLKSYNMYEMPALEPVQLEPFFERLRAMLEHDVAAKGITLEVACRTPGLAVLADPRALQQVLLNLVTNAVDAVVGRTEARIVVSAVAAGNYGLLEVRDTGCGIPAALQANLFKPFFTSKPGGTGLGLVIVRKMVSKMEGTIEIVSAEGQGTAAVVSLKREPNVGSTHARDPHPRR